MSWWEFRGFWGDFAKVSDLYDNTTGKIPFDKFEQFFKANLH